MIRISLKIAKYIIKIIKEYLTALDQEWNEYDQKADCIKIILEKIIKNEG